jgi:hypothetical protein
MPTSTANLTLDRSFTPQQYARLCAGLIPEVMEDKWFIFMEGDWLFFHRSWTGTCVYQVRLERDGEFYVAAEALSNRDQEQYRETNNRYDSALLGFLIDNLLLGKQTPFPVPSDQPEDTPKGVYQHHVSGSGYPEVKVDKNKE